MRGNGRVRGVTHPKGGHADVLLSEGWQVARAAPGSITDPKALASASLAWTAVAKVPATAASALRDAKEWSLDGPPRRFDAEDWWWRVTIAPGELFGEARTEPGDELTLCFDGIATIAEVWVDGERVIQSENMFVAHRVPLPAGETSHEIVICCRSVDARLAMKRPRPKWRAPMIEHAQLRWIRTTLLGRTPGWSPPAAAVGPWRPVRLVRQRDVAIDELSFRASVEGDHGVVEVVASTIRSLDGKERSAALVVERGGSEHRIPLQRDASTRLVIPKVERWWPHTHGEPALHRAWIEIQDDIRVDLGTIGFREVEAKIDDDGFTLFVNGTRIFCRGACWTPLDVVTLASDDREAYDAAMTQIARAGMNMLRLSGAMSYESPAFFDATDAQGVLVWHDLMFANMDYPEEDAAFAASIKEEVTQHLCLLEGRPSIAVVCGNSEGEQQAAMFGASRDKWSPPLFHETLPKLTRSVLPDVPYWPSSAHGGPAFPHQVDHGTTSYYGVGAYQLPLSDARRSGVRFATECLAFANISSGLISAKVHQPQWKERTPRDLGAGWDFDDVRDHYVERLFRVNVPDLRYSDHDRYVALGRVITGEVIAQTFGEWRRARSRCAGGLVWFLRDLWQGAGWGVIGANGEPKAAYHYMKRACQPLALHISDEGNNGLYLHVVNDTASAMIGEVEIVLFKNDAQVGRTTSTLTVEARSATEVAIGSLFEGFLDLNHAFRFGPPTCDLVVARFEGTETFHFPVGLFSQKKKDLGLTAVLARPSEGSPEVDITLTTTAFAESVAIEIEGYAADDDYFHLAPGASKTVRIRPLKNLRQAPRGLVTPLNAESPIGVTLPK